MSFYPVTISVVLIRLHHNISFTAVSGITSDSLIYRLKESKNNNLVYNVYFLGFRRDNVRRAVAESGQLICLHSSYGRL